MKAVELLKASKKIMELLSKCDIKTDDYKHLDLYDKYRQMLEQEEKLTYIVLYLADYYHTSESTVRRIIKRFGRDVKF